MEGDVEKVGEGAEDAGVRDVDLVGDKRDELDAGGREVARLDDDSEAADPARLAGGLRAERGNGEVNGGFNKGVEGVAVGGADVIDGADATGDERGEDIRAGGDRGGERQLHLPAVRAEDGAAGRSRRRVISRVVS